MDLTDTTNLEEERRLVMLIAEKIIHHHLIPCGLGSGRVSLVRELSFFLVDCRRQSYSSCHGEHCKVVCCYNDRSWS